MKVGGLDLLLSRFNVILYHRELSVLYKARINKITTAKVTIRQYCKIFILYGLTKRPVRLCLVCFNVFMSLFFNFSVLPDL